MALPVDYVQGFVNMPVESVTESDTMVRGNMGFTYPMDTSTGDVTLTLPEAATCEGLRVYFYVSDATNWARVITQGAETIDGLAGVRSTTLYSSIHVISDGSNWLICCEKGTWVSI